MTPIAERLSVNLATELRRMNDEWFFKWHFIGRDGPVEIDNFRGGKIRYGGIGFEGTPRMVYWDTVDFYLTTKISELFDEVEKAIQNYPLEVRTTAVDECCSTISGFLGQVRQAAIEKDRVPRGNGFTFPPHDEARGRFGACYSAIASRADGLRAVYCIPPKPLTYAERVEVFLKERKESLGWIGAGIAKLIGVARFFGVI